MPALLAPDCHLAQQLLGELLVADEVVVHEEDLGGAQAVALLDLRHHLRHRLRARAPAVHHDDVAELAVEWAAPGELDRERVIAVRPGADRSAASGDWVRSGFSSGRYSFFQFPASKSSQEARPGLLGLIDEEHVTAPAKLLGAERSERATHRHEASAAAELLDDLEHALLVHDVAGDADDVGLDVEVDLARRSRRRS